MDRISGFGPADGGSIPPGPVSFGIEPTGGPCSRFASRNAIRYSSLLGANRSPPGVRG